MIREGDPRQPLYANAPPKPRRLNTSRDYSPSPDNSPERLSHSTFSPEHEMIQMSTIMPSTKAMMIMILPMAKNLIVISLRNMNSNVPAMIS